MRIRKLKETLLPKPTLPDGNTITPYPINPIDHQSPPVVQMAHYDQQNLQPTSPGATHGGFDAHQVLTPPASAGPGLKGFMARFRRQRSNNTPQDYELRSHPHNHSVSTSSSSSPHGTSTPEQVFSAPATRESFEISRALHRSRPPRLPPPKIQRSEADIQNGSADEINDEDQRRKLFEAASNLGLDQSALNDLLSRSVSVNRESSNATTSKISPAVVAENGISRSKSLTAPTGAMGLSGTPQRPEDLPVRRSYRARGDHARTLPPGQSNAVDNAVVRRTLIFPSEISSNLDVNFLMRRSSSARRRRSTTGSVTSSRSVHDRAPTPPPPRSPTSKRFSNNLPPVPQLPPSLSTQSENILHVHTSTGPVEKSSSTYDSLCVMSSLVL
jgi:serine/arginine repetitive matrix protein 2